MRRRVFLWSLHWEGVGEVWETTAALDRQQKVKAAALKAGEIPQAFVIPQIPYKSQLDNELNPTGACNVTCFAMVATLFGIQQNTGIKQLEDEFYRYMEDRGLSRHSPHDLKKLAEAYGMTCDFTERATHDQVRARIASGRPCIGHGYLTSFGHIIVFMGYDQKGYRVHDPNGEWWPNGYDINTETNPNKGRDVHMSRGLIDRTFRHDGNFWIHFLDHPDYQPQIAQPVATSSLSSQPEWHTLKVIQATFFKDDPQTEASRLPDDRKRAIPANTTFEVDVLRAAFGHEYVKFKGDEKGIIKPGEHWWVYSNHVQHNDAQIAFDIPTEVAVAATPKSSGLDVSSDQLMQMIKSVAHHGLQSDELGLIHQSCLEGFPTYGITTANRIAHFLSQCAHETGGFWWLEEIWGPTEDQLYYDQHPGLANETTR